MPEAEGGISLPSEADLSKLPEDERLMQAAEAAKAAANANGMVESLKAKAAALTNPKERERMLTEAYNYEMKANGLSKKAKILKSGTFQGAVGGAGIGAATGVGLGTVVGTVVGTVATIPTTAVGTLVGSGVGMIHGPWIKLSGGKDGEEVQVPKEAVENGAVEVDEKTGTMITKDPEALQKAAEAAEKAALVSKDHQGTGEKRKPKKLEVRSKKTDADSKTVKTPGPDASKTKRKPPKLEVRSKKTQTPT